MSTPAVKFAVEKLNKAGHGSSDPNESQKTKVDVTISGAPDAAKGANGDYSLHLTPLKSEEIPYYQGIKGDSNQMYIIYSKERNRWEIASNMATESERKVGVVAYIACDEQSAKQKLIGSVADKKDWYTPNKDGSSGTLATDMVAIVHSGDESTAAAEAPAPDSSTVASPAASASTVAVTASPVAAPLSVPKIQTLEEMKKVLANIDKEYGVVSTEYAKLSPESSEQDWIDFQTKILTPANSKLVEASSQLEEYIKPKGVDTTPLLAPEVDKSLEVDKSQGSESVKKQYETLLSILKNIPNMKKVCEENHTFIAISIFLELAKRAIDNSELLKDIIDTSLLDPDYFLTEQAASSSTNAVTMKHFITAIIFHSILENLLGAKIVDTQAAAATEAQAPEKRENVWETIRTNREARRAAAIRPVEQPPSENSAFSFLNGGQRGGDITKDTKIQCKLYQTVLDIISSFPLDDKPPESLYDILNRIIGYMSTDKFADSLKEKWDTATESGFDGGSSSSKSKKNKKSYKSHKSYHPKIGKTRKHHNTHNKPKRVSFIHQS